VLRIETETKLRVGKSNSNKSIVYVNLAFCSFDVVKANQMLLEADKCLSSSGSTVNNSGFRKRSQKVKPSKVLKEEKIDQCPSASNIKNESCHHKFTDQCQATSRNTENESDCWKLIRKEKSSRLTTITAIKVKAEMNNTSEQQLYSSWARQYKELVSYVREFGDARVPQRYAKNPVLGRWVNRQRSDYKQFLKGNTSYGGITKEKIRLLYNIGFEWSSRTRGRDTWDGQYGEIMSYAKKFGNARVPIKFQANPSLGNWVSTQRISYKKFLNGNTSCGIVKRKIQLLNNIGFEWNITSLVSWDDRYEELVIYAKEFGNARVPTKFPANQPLGNWVNKQRSNYKKFLNGNALSGITKEQIQLLDNIGFEWSVISAVSWYDRYEELVIYAKEFGNARVPSRFPENPGLGTWVIVQRRRYKKKLIGNTSCGIQTRIQLLNNIGFEWNIHGSSGSTCQNV